MFEVGLVTAYVNLSVLGVRHDLQQVLRQHVEAVDVVQAEDQNSSFGELEVGRGDRRYPLQTARVPKLELLGKRTQQLVTLNSGHECSKVDTNNAPFLNKHHNQARMF